MIKQLLAFVRRRRLDRDLDREVRFHIEMETSKNVQRGMDPAMARTLAFS